MTDKVWIFGDYSQAETRVVAWAGPVPSLKTWFKNKEDVHLNVAKVIAKVIQENKVIMPGSLFKKSWESLTKSDEEREKGKQTGHAGNYGLGYDKAALYLAIPPQYAKIILNIYHEMFPEIKGGYQKWIDECLPTIVLPEPFNWPHSFYDRPSPERSRVAYASYAQGTIGLLLVRTLVRCCEIFSRELPEATVMTPNVIRSQGLDVQLQVHDSIGISVPNDREVIQYTCQLVRKEAEYPLIIKGEPLIIPMDFKVGKSWAKEDLHDYSPDT